MLKSMLQSIPRLLTCRIYPLTIKNNLVISGNSVFRANGLNITIGGNLINNNSSSGTGLSSGGYQPGTSGQLTTFNGSGTNTISGSGSNLTNFAHMNVAKTGSLTLTPNSNIRINGNLNLLSGTLEDGGNNISLAGNMVNNAEHASTLAGGGIVLEGSQTQVISGNGNGIFGNLTLNNTTGISMVDDATINGILTFCGGSVYIDDYLITLGVNASIGGTPDENNMIITERCNIRCRSEKDHSPPVPSGFSFPFGVAGKYTPADFMFTSNTNSSASMTVNPVNYSHPLVSLPGGDELDYYWRVVSEGFSGSFTVTHSYLYIEDDVNGTESDYVTGRFLNGIWIPEGGIDESSVNPSTHQITLADRDFIDGEYTAGSSLNFANKPVLYSIKSGSWSGDNTWSTTDGGPSCNCDPDGNPVVINAGHIVTINNNSAFAYSIALYGSLDIGTTLYHNLGYVRGDGLLRITSTTNGIFVMPGGNYDEFLSNQSSTIELYRRQSGCHPIKTRQYLQTVQQSCTFGLRQKINPGR